MQLGRGELFKPFDDQDSAVREARFRYFIVFSEHEPEVIISLRESCFKFYEKAGVHSYNLLVDLVEGKASRYDYSVYYYEPYKQDYLELREAINRWYRDFFLERLGEWCKDVGLALLSEVNENREDIERFTGFRYLSQYPAPTDPVLKGVPDFYSYLVSKKESEEKRIGPIFSRHFRYNPSKSKRKKFKKLMLLYFQNYIDEYAEMVEEQARSQGYTDRGNKKRQTKIGKKKRQAGTVSEPTEHFHWLYLRHIEKRTCDEVAEEVNKVQNALDKNTLEEFESVVSPQNVCDATTRLANLIGVSLGPRGLKMQANGDVEGRIDTRLSDKHWKRIEPFLPPQPSVGRRRKQDREVLSSLVYRFRTGCQYRDIPRGRGYASPSTTHHWASRWEKDGVFDQIWNHLLAVLDDEGRLKITKKDFNGSSVINKKGESDFAQKVHKKS